MPLALSIRALRWACAARPCRGERQTSPPVVAAALRCLRSLVRAHPLLVQDAALVAELLACYDARAVGDRLRPRPPPAPW